MYVVIFRARIREMDETPQPPLHCANWRCTVRTGAALRELALRDFGCMEFCAVSEGGAERVLSCWPDLASITAWKAQADHLLAQRLGRERWYASYRVQIARVEREYVSPKAAP